MESETSTTRIDKLDHSNYHFWKMRFEHLLILKDLENFLHEDPPNSTDLAAIFLWHKKDKKAQAIIGLSLSNDLLESVRDVKTTKEMWVAIRNVFERHTLLIKLSARKKFYTAAMNIDESVLQFANRIRQLASTLKSMNVVISESEMAMALLNGLPEEYNALISALDAIDEDETKLKFEFIKSRAMQEEQRISMRAKSAQEKSEAAALVMSQSNQNNDKFVCNSRFQRRCLYCNFCKRPGHIESRSCTKFPHLAPGRQNNSNSSPDLIANQSDDEEIVCLIAKYGSSSEPENSDKWFVNSGCSNHMTFNKSLFLSYTAGHPSSVELGNSNTAGLWDR